MSTTYKFEIKVLLDKPPAGQMPIKTGINFKKLLSKEERKGKIIDVSRLQMKEIIRGEEKDIPVQFSGKKNSMLKRNLLEP